VSLVVQPSLFGSVGELGVADLGDAVERRPLSDGAWIDLRPGFVTAADELFDVLARVVPWHEEQMHIYDNTVRSRGSWPATRRARRCRIRCWTRRVRR
jgi:hypothetical protein